MRRHLRLVVIVLIALFTLPKTNAQTTVKKVVLQAFWWDYWNSNHPGSWANYLTELAPRIKAMGIDAIWIPPISKGNSGEGSVGYDIFDHYDLGDKFQKNSVNTRVGTKDELLRMIAVMHANGIEVIQDVVLNHTIGAGDLDGELGKDPSSPDDQYKNFRYASYGNHAVYKSSDNYLSRNGRWPKNHQNFHPNPGHSCNSGDICQQMFGPDICYEGGAYGQSSNAGYNPTQGTNYMRDQARSWVVWLKKQTGVDGFRWDATKHFPEWVQQDLSYNLKYLAGFANGNEAMFNVGEYVDFSAANLDGYVNSVTNANGGSDFMMGAFDFSLRAGMKNMIDGNGFYDMSFLPGFQQNQRVAYYAGPNLYVHRTVPFVNNHDTFRPQLDANGNYTGWNTGSELAPHIDPFNDRMPLAYALAFAVDGAPQIFFEDLFDLGGTSKRYAHEPSSTVDLPVRTPLEKIIMLHQQLDFKSGVYKVRSTVGGGNVFFNPGSSAQDLLVVERSGRAIIAMNDNGSSMQEAYVDTDFPPGTILVDHAGYISGTSTVFGDQRALIQAPPVDPNNGTYGFAIWGPQGALPVYNQSGTTTTTQEWEMNDDLGDSHPFSLKQGGRIPDNSTEWRYAGKIFVEAGETVSWQVYADATKDLTVEFVTYVGASESVQSGVGNISGSFTASATGWIDMRLRNTTGIQLGQVCYLNVTYKAPTTIPDVDVYPSDLQDAVWTGAHSQEWSNPLNWKNNRLPSPISNVVVPSSLINYPEVASDVKVSALAIRAGAELRVISGFSLTADILTIEADASDYGVLESKGTTIINDNITSQQYINGKGWHQLTPTVANRPVSDWGTVGSNAPGGNASTTNLFTWNSAMAEWTEISNAGDLTNNGTGYNLFVGNYGVLPNSSIIESTGDFISSYTPNLNYTTSLEHGDGWNFIGNSLTAAIDFTTLITSGIDNAFYIWDPATGSYKSWSGGGINDPYIAPMQGFWVRANNSAAPNIGTIDFNHTILNPTVDLYKTSSQFEHIVLNLSTNEDTTVSDELVFTLHENTHDGFDSGWDAKKKINSDGINFYSTYANEKMSINTIKFDPNLDQQKIVPISLRSGSYQSYCISLNERYLNLDIKVYLKDYKKNTLNNLMYSDYCFEDEGNQLALVLSNRTLTNKALETYAVDAYSTDDALVINLLGKERGQFCLSDINGRTVFKGNLVHGENRFNTDLPQGVYLLQVKTNSHADKIFKLMF